MQWTASRKKMRTIQVGRKPKTQRVHRTRAGGEWTEAAFWGFMRGILREGVRKWPPVVRLALDKVRRKNQSTNKRLKWEFQCYECGHWFPRKEVEVDHIVPCGSLRSWDEFRTFSERLFCETDGLAIRCKTCHQEKTNQGRK